MIEFAGLKDQITRKAKYDDAHDEMEATFSSKQIFSNNIFLHSFFCGDDDYHHFSNVNNIEIDIKEEGKS